METVSLFDVQDLPVKFVQLYGIRVETESDCKDFSYTKFLHDERRLVVDEEVISQCGHYLKENSERRPVSLVLEEPLIELFLRGTYEGWMKSYPVDEITLRKRWGACEHTSALLAEIPKCQQLTSDLLCSMKFLTSFSLCSGNDASLLPIVRIPDIISQVKSLKKFVVKDKLAEGVIHEIARALQVNPNLEVIGINISNCYHAHSLFESLGKLPNLTSLMLENFPRNVEVSEHLERSLSSIAENTSLESFFIKECDWGETLPRIIKKFSMRGNAAYLNLESAQLEGIDYYDDEEEDGNQTEEGNDSISISNTSRLVLKHVNPSIPSKTLFPDMSRLVSLKVEALKCSQQQLDDFCHWISELKSICSLDITIPTAQLQNTEKLISALQALPDLEIIHLGGSLKGEQTMHLLNDALTKRLLKPHTIQAQVGKTKCLSEFWEALVSRKQEYQHFVNIELAPWPKEYAESLMILQEDNRKMAELAENLMLCNVFKKAAEKSPAIADYSLITRVKKLLKRHDA
jgi:hypothetical protein